MSDQVAAISTSNAAIAGSSRSVQRWQPWIGAAAAIVLGGIFIVAGVMKGADPQLFAKQIEGYEIVPQSFALPLAHLFIATELLLGFCVALLILPRLGITALIGLLVLFIGATGWAWAHGNAEHCGCFGRAASRGPLGVILEDIGFLAIGLIALRFAPRLRWRSRLRSAVFLVLVPFLVSASIWLPRAPVDRWVTPIKPGADLSTIAADGLRVSLNTDRVLLALVGNGCAECVSAIPTLNAIAKTEGAPKVAAIFAGTNNDSRAFRLEHVPEFPIGHSPEVVLRQYYRRLPVFVLMQDGIIERAWWGAPPEPREVDL